MTKEEEIIKECEQKLIYAWSKANTKSKKKRLMYDLNTLSLLSSIYPSIAKEYNWEENLSYLELFEEINIPFLNNIMENKELFSKCFNNVIEIFKVIDFPFYKDYRKQNRVLSEKESEEIMFSFLNDYNPSMLQKYQELIREGKIFSNNPIGSSALFCSLDTLKESFIYPTSDPKNSIYKSSLLAHELGHCFENEIFYQTGNNNYRRESNISPFNEVSSRSFEYAYLNYLIENNIYKEDAKTSLRRYYIDLLIHSYDISIIYQLKDIKINEHNCIVLEDDKIIEYGNQIMNDLNFSLLYIEKGDMFDLRESFIYGLGNILSIYLYESYKENPNDYRKEFRNSLLNYPSNGIEAFKNLGITKDKLLSLKELTKTLIKSK